METSYTCECAQREADFLGDRLQGVAHLIGRGGNKDFLNLWRVSREYWGGSTALVVVGVLRPHLHKEEFHVLAGPDLIGRREV